MLFEFCECWLLDLLGCIWIVVFWWLVRFSDLVALAVFVFDACFCCFLCFGGGTVWLIVDRLGFNNCASCLLLLFWFECGGFGGLYCILGGFG